MKFALTTIFLAWTAMRPESARAIEPLKGPMIGQTTTRTLPTRGSGNEFTDQRQRSADFDIPIPVAVGQTMPFAFIRYQDSQVIDRERSWKYFMRTGAGLMHHAAEGDPAFRLDVSRVGGTTDAPHVWSRALFNTGKFIPWLRLDPADDLKSWIGLNYISKWRSTGLLFPEFSWQRQARDGTLVDLTAPSHLILGLRGSIFGLFAGARQTIIRWNDKGHEDSGHEDRGYHWTFRRESLLKLEWYLADEYTLTGQLTRDLEDYDDTRSTGFGVFLRWTPNS